jgi:periplasmic protein TonB
LGRSSFAFFVALLIHILLLLLYWALLENAPQKVVQEKEQEKIKISLKEMPPKKKESGVQEQQVKPTSVAPPMPKGSQLKEIVQKPPVQYKKPEVQKPTKLNPPEPKKTSKPLPKPDPMLAKKPFIELEKLEEDQKEKEPKKEQKPKDPLYALLSQDRSDQEEKKEKKQIQSGNSINQNIKELYGEEFGKLTPGQQKYILDNQEIMRRITQQVLNRVARVNLSADLNVNRTNVIEFYLHPNGDMSDFKFLHKSGYYVLDDTTRETIEYAYSRYPRPSEKTLIRYNVYYNLARY